VGGLHSLRFGIYMELTSYLINPNFLAGFNQLIKYLVPFKQGGINYPNLKPTINGAHFTLSDTILTNRSSRSIVIYLQLKLFNSSFALISQDLQSSYQSWPPSEYGPCYSLAKPFGHELVSHVRKGEITCLSDQSSSVSQ